MAGGAVAICTITGKPQSSPARIARRNGSDSRRTHRGAFHPYLDPEDQVAVGIGDTSKQIWITKVSKNPQAS